MPVDTVLSRRGERPVVVKSVPLARGLTSSSPKPSGCAAPPIRGSSRWWPRPPPAIGGTPSGARGSIVGCRRHNATRVCGGGAGCARVHRRRPPSLGDHPRADRGLTRAAGCAGPTRAVRLRRWCRRRAPSADVAGLGRLLRELLGSERVDEPMVERRWGRSRRSHGSHRRGLLLLADQACAEPPTRRPTAERLAAAIAAAVPEVGPEGSGSSTASETSPRHRVPGDLDASSPRTRMTASARRALVVVGLVVVGVTALVVPARSAKDRAPLRSFGHRRRTGIEVGHPWLPPRARSGHRVARWRDRPRGGPLSGGTRGRRGAHRRFGLRRRSDRRGPPACHR